VLLALPVLLLCGLTCTSSLEKALLASDAAASKRACGNKPTTSATLQHASSQRKHLHIMQSKATDSQGNSRYDLQHVTGVLGCSTMHARVCAAYLAALALSWRAWVGSCRWRRPQVLLRWQITPLQHPRRLCTAPTRGQTHDAHTILSATLKKKQANARMHSLAVILYIHRVILVPCMGRCTRMPMIEAAGTCAVAVIALLVKLGLHTKHSSSTASISKQSQTVLNTAWDVGRLLINHLDLRI
jgi:hypothetical protein